MINTEDLPSYIAGYEEYIEKMCEEEPVDDRDFYEDFVLRKELEKMERNIINLNITNMTFEEIMQLTDFVWKQDKLIPVEMIEGD